MKKLIEVFWDGNRLAHSQASGNMQGESFLGDAAALLLAVTMLRENDETWADTMNSLARTTARFQVEGRWIEANIPDFKPVAASTFDHPTPASVSLAVMGLARAAVLNSEPVERLEYLRPHQSDFYNVAAMFTQGLFHQVHSRAAVAWSRLPANAIQLRREPESDCYSGQCQPLRF